MLQELVWLYAKLFKSLKSIFWNANNKYPNPIEERADRARQGWRTWMRIYIAIKVSNGIIVITTEKIERTKSGNPNKWHCQKMNSK